MARRKKKKLNRKLVIILSVVLGLLVLAGGAGVWKFRHRIFPLDPQECARKGQLALQKGDHVEAIRQFHTAAFYSRKKKIQQAKYYMQSGAAFLDGYENSTKLTETEKRQFLGSAMEDLQKACNLDLDYVEPRQFRFDILWNEGSPRGSADEIITAASEVIKVAPKNDRVYYVRGRMRGLLTRQTNDDKYLKRAFADFDKAIELKGDEPSYWIAKVSLMEWTERFVGQGEGEKGYIQALEKLPDSALLRVAYSNYLMRNKREEDAVKQIKEAIKRQPDEAAGYSAMARVQLIEGNKDEAQKYLAKAIKLAPTNVNGYDFLSKLMQQNGEFDKVGKLLQAGIEKVSEELQKISPQQRVDLRRMKNAKASLQYMYTSNLLKHYIKSEDQDKREKLLEEATSMVSELKESAIREELISKVEGQIAYYNKDYPTATSKLSEVYESMGVKDVESAIMLVTLYQRTGLPGKAEAILNKFLELPGQQDNPQILLALARVKMGYRDYPQARALINRVLERNSSNKKAIALSGELSLAEGVSTVIGADISPRGIALVLERADQLASDMNQEEAIAIVEKLYNAVPKNLKVIEKLANLYLVTGQKEKAVIAIDKAMKDYPDNELLAFQRKLIDADPDTRLKMQIEKADEIEDEFKRCMQKAAIYVRFGKRDEAQKLIDRASELAPKNPIVVQMQMQKAMQDKQWDKAKEVIARLYEPESLNYKVLEAQIEVAAEQYDNALGILEPLRKANPDSRPVLFLLGDVYTKQKQYENAEEVYARIRSNNPGDIQTLIRLAAIAQQQGQWEKNEEYVREAYRLPKGRRNKYIVSRYMEIRETSAETSDEDLAKVIARREATLKSNPKNMDNLARLAAIYEVRTRQLDKAEQVYRFAYDQGGKKIAQARMLISFYSRTNNSAKAESILQEGLDKATDNKSKVQWTILQGDYLFEQDETQAFNAYKKAIQTDPMDPAGRKAMATYYARKSQWVEAAKEMGNYLDIATDDVLGRKIRIEYLINARDYKQADENIQVLLQSNPEDTESQFLKARMELAQGNAAKALQALNLILEKTPDYVNALMLRGRAYMISGELNSCKQDLERARSLAGSPQIEMELADVYLRMNDSLSAENAFNSIVKENPGYQAARNQLIELYLRTDNMMKARSAIDEAKRLYPGDPYYLMAEARYFDGIGSIGGKIDSLSKAVKAAPRSQQIVMQYLSALAQGKRSKELLNEVGKFKSNAEWIPWLEALEARGRLDVGQTKEADGLFLKSLKSAPQQMVSFVVTQIRQSYGMRRAIIKLSQWSQARPEDWMLRAQLADLYSTAAVIDPDLTDEEKGKYNLNAAKFYEGIISQAPNAVAKAQIQNRLGRVYYSLGEYEKSEKAYLDCLQVLNRNIGALNNIAYLYVDVFDKPQKAEPYAKKAYELALSDPNVLDTYGWVLARMGKYNEAESILQLSLDRKNLVAARYHLGWVYEKTDNRVNARKQYSRGLELLSGKKTDPLYEKIAEALARVGGK